MIDVIAVKTLLITMITVVVIEVKITSTILITAVQAVIIIITMIIKI